MRSIRNILVIVLLSTISNCLFAYKWKGEINKSDQAPTTRATASCDPPRTSTDLAVNNVRTRVHTGGDMWWDLQGKPLYEVPVGGGAHALYAGSIWVGGLDSNGQLKMAAQKFRQRGYDFWPGPLITDGAEKGSVSFEICNEYDKHFEINKAMVAEFRNWWQCQQDPECDLEELFPDGYTPPNEIINWPAKGPAGGYAADLAPYYDVDKDGQYDPLGSGDFPYYEFINDSITDDINCERPRRRQPKLFGDYTLWWVYNDRGNIHTETGGSPIGMEFKSQAFAFTTNDELNNMTFYNYNIINRSTYTLYNTYFGVWTDADLGYPEDDYTGCDVQRGLGYMYNGDNDDETAGGHIGYGTQPPAIGIDFFEGPYQDPTGMDKPTSYDTINGIKVLNCTKGDILNGNINGLNFGDGEPDNERWGMRRFLYFNNTGKGANEYTTDPQNALEHYNYITGKWRDNTPLIYGGTGHYSSPNADQSVTTDFMFPGNPTTDICGWGQGGNPMPDWSEETEGNAPDDRRFVQSAGPFTLYPGAVNDITLGAVYARAASGGPWASVEAVQRADDKAQLLFENCFRVLNGPDAPDLKIIELDKKLIFHISNRPNSNNYLDRYAERDPSMVCGGEVEPCDTAYRFQGYQVFQFRDGAVSITDRYNPDMVKEVFQCDIKDGVTKLVNYTWSDELGANVPVLEVQGSDGGIVHTFVVNKDMFSDGALVNNKEYYYSALAYGYNSTLRYNQAIPETFYGQKTPYIAGRNNIIRYTAIPHKNIADGTILQSDYGTGVEITMIDGFGNGNNIIDLSKESIDQIMQGPPWNVRGERVYNIGRGPLNVKIIDPLNVPEDIYWLRFDSITSNAYGIIGTDGLSIMNQNSFRPFSYVIYNSKDTIRSEVAIRYGDRYEQLFSQWGFSITMDIDNFALVGQNSYQNGFLEASMEFSDETKRWLVFVPDQDGQNPLNWIRAGSFKSKAGEVEGAGEQTGVDPAYNDVTIKIGRDDFFADPDQHFENVLGGTWSPYILASPYQYGLRPFNDNSIVSDMKPYLTEILSSVDIVITSDKSKWTRCCVIEMAENEWAVNDKGFLKEVTPPVNYRSKDGALKFSLRKDPSVDKEGNPLNDGTHGFGWFPGYAIDIRTGERLNMAFGEDSWLKSENGDDMIWNPTSSYTNKGDLLLGGKHYIYVFGNNTETVPQESNGPAYDSCNYLHSMLMRYEQTRNSMTLKRAWQPAMWCAIPLVNNSYNLLETDVKIRLRVATPYTRAIQDMVIEDAPNNNNPMFTFSTERVKTIINDRPRAVSALDSIRAVPNPYYGTSDYEHEQLDNYIRITNLPRRCDIDIYNTAGTLIRRFRKDNTDTFLQWDLKNSYNIAVSSGVYIIHIKAYDQFDANSVVGEKVIKWFGALRPVDLNNF